MNWQWLSVPTPTPKFAGIWDPNGSYEGPLNRYFTETLADYWTNSRMPDTEAGGTFDKSQTAIVARRGQMLTTAVVPDWGRLTVDDPYTEAAKGMRHVTVSAICGDLLLVQADAYQQTYWRLSA